jgi:hypothetical protein
MSKSNVKKNVTDNDKKMGSAWDEAIADAETRIQDARIKIAELKNTVRVFREWQQRGERWPGAA